jgi:hypothetical protein
VHKTAPDTTEVVMQQVEGTPAGRFVRDFALRTSHRARLSIVIQAMMEITIRLVYAQIVGGIQWTPHAYPLPMA